MALGALIVSIGYFIGSLNHDVKAQETPNKIVCDELLVKNSILVGDDPDKGYILIKVENGQQGIRIGGDGKGSINLYVKDELQFISILDGIDPKNLEPKVFIYNSNGKNGMSVGSSDEGIGAITSENGKNSILVGKPDEGVVSITSENGITTMLLDDANGYRLIKTQSNKE